MLGTASYFPPVGQPLPVVQNSSLMAQNPSLVAQNSSLVVQNPSLVSQNPPQSQSLPVTHNPSLGQSVPVTQNLLLVAQNPSSVVQNSSPVAQNSSLLDHNPPQRQSLPVTHNPSVGQNISVIAAAATNQRIIPPTIRCVEIISHKQSVRELSASQINTAELIDPDIVIRKYPSYQCLNRVPTLAQRLANQSYFGDDVLGKCTVMGCRHSPALPLRELNNLKQKLFLVFPQFWANPLDFEDTWSRCTVAIGQRCKRLVQGMATARTTGTV